ncbi:MAG: SPFH domain-containing protein [Oscillospiraceae bacterium]|nr:SPFH domain-containing protein [Oscillospiraceae bacterium]
MKNKKAVSVEIPAKAASGMTVLIINLLLMITSVVGVIIGITRLEKGDSSGTVFLVSGMIYLALICWFLFAGLRVLKPNEALVLTLFGKYYGTLKGDGFFWVNPFVSAVNPAFNTTTATVTEKVAAPGASAAGLNNKKISLKSMTLSNEQQKINDLLGNPVIIGINVIWRVTNTAKAVFCVDNYKEYLSIQCDSALRNIIRLYPYDVSDGDNEKSLRGSSQEIADKLKDEIQAKVDIAGLEIIEARITHLSYAQEIAAIMLQRQQASAIVDARKMIVDGAVGMVEMALGKLNEKQIVNLDEERKAAMVSNLLVVLCGNRDAQPVVNSGSLY